MLIEKMLVLSTGHITEETANILNEAAEDYPPFCDLEWRPTFARDESWVFYVRPLASNGVPDEAEDTPPELSRIYALAREQGCEWVMLDCDGERLEALPWHEW